MQTESRLSRVFENRIGMSYLGNDLMAKQACAGSVAVRERSQEELEKEKAECEAREKEYFRRAVASAIVGIAENLVVNHNVSVDFALERAEQLATSCSNFVKNYKLPEAEEESDIPFA